MSSHLVLLETMEGTVTKLQGSHARNALMVAYKIAQGFAFYNKQVTAILIINEYLSKSNLNLVHYLSCQAVRPIACLDFCYGCMLTSRLGLGLEG